MMNFVPLLPGILATAFIFYSLTTSSRFAPAKVFINLYIPILLLFPRDYVAVIPGLPDLSFSQSAILPIFVASLCIPHKKTFSVRKKIRATDVLVIGYVVVCVISEYVNTGTGGGTAEGRLWLNLLTRNILNVILPYFLAKKLIHPSGLTPDLAKRIVICTLITLLICSYEWRFVVNLHHKTFEWLFSSAGQNQWRSLFRYGMVRLAGPFPHAILFGIMIATALLWNHWLTKNRLWRNHFTFLPLSSYTKGHLLSIMLFIGLVLTFSRGPLYSTAIAAALIGLGYSRHRKISLFFRLLIFFGIGIFALQAISYYSELSKSLASSELEGTASYRAKLFETYLTYVQEKPWLGWGFLTMPEAEGMASIDNQYLWILLKHGAFALSLQIAILAFTCFGLLYRGLKVPCQYREDQSLSITLLTILMMVGISLITVYMGGQIENMFFILIGWSQGFLSVKQKEECPTSDLLISRRSRGFHNDTKMQ